MSFVNKVGGFLETTFDLTIGQVIKDAERGINEGQQNREALLRLSKQVEAIQSERKRRGLEQRTAAALSFESLKFSPLVNLGLLFGIGFLAFKVFTK